MNKNKILVMLALIGLAGCQSTPSNLYADKEAEIGENSTLQIVTAEGLSDERNITVPAGYSVKEFTRLSIAPYITKVGFDKDSIQTTIDNGMPAIMLGDGLARTQRFVVLDRTSTARDYEVTFQAENTRSEGAIVLGEALNPDYILEASVQLGTSTKKISDERGNYQELTFRSVVSAKLIDGTTREIKHAFPPIRYNLEPKTYVRSKNREWIAGFKYTEPEVIDAAYQEAAQKSLQVLVTDVMQQFPVGGKAVHYRSNRFAIAAGSSEGLPTQGVKIPAIIFLDEFGLPIPLASGYLTPGGEHSSTFEVIKWKESDKDAMSIRKKLEALGKDYLDRNKIYAVSVGTSADWKL
ncbi:hypothetical protein [Moritella dasanensis]|uniref:hypothetical protein n=1 Tax=Moritella dasanensis TaxID=428031 RepID=UPI0002D448FA|nr:hypothetical protein [Moritella dasanensis]